MSEYQYYEFQAVDRPLTKDEMADLRAISTRATITPTRFVNVYNYGDLNADPLDLVERYFDAFVYVANWGTHQLAFRIPRRLLDPATALRDAFEDCLDVREKGEFVIVEFISRDEDGGGWVDDEEAAGWLPSLLPLREDIARGDWRGLYLAWLAGAQVRASYDREAAAAEDDKESDWDDEDDESDRDEDQGGEADMTETIEPPVPPGLRDLSASLTALAEFLRIDTDLLTAAATASPDLPTQLSPGDYARWVTALPAAEKDAWLVRFVTEDPGSVRVELTRQLEGGNSPSRVAATGGRSVAALLAAADEQKKARRRQEAEQAAVGRAKHMASLVGRESELWQRVENLIDAKRPKEYDDAVAILKDLRDLATWQDSSERFIKKLRQLQTHHANRPAFLKRLQSAGLNV